MNRTERAIYTLARAIVCGQFTCMELARAINSVIKWEHKSKAMRDEHVPAHLLDHAPIPKRPRLSLQLSRTRS